MQEDLLKIVNHYGINNQLRKFIEECFELIEAIVTHELKKSVEYEIPLTEIVGTKEHITEEIADNYVMVYQFPKYYYDRLEYHNIAPYEFKTDNYEHIDDISKYLKKFQKEEVCKFICAIAIAEERKQDYISEYEYEELIEKIDDVIYKLKSIQLYYKISDKEIEEVEKFKIARQLERIKNETVAKNE